MINKNKKIKYFNFSAYECTAIEEFLEEMAEKGWLLESISGSRFKFTKIEPQNLKFSVEPVSQVSNLDAPDSNIALEYREYCESAEWKYVCEKGKLQIFYCDKSSEILPIHTDENEKFKAIFKSSLFDISLKLLLIALISFNIYNSISSGSISYFLSSNLSLASILLFIVLLLTNLVEIASFIRWSIKAKLELINGKLLPYNTLKQLRAKNLIKKLITIVTLIFFLLIVIFDKNSFTVASTSLIITASMIIVILLIDIFTRKFLIKSKYSKRTNILIRLISISFTFLLSIFIIFLTITIIAGNGFIGENNISKKNLPLTLNDFDTSLSNSTDLYIDENSSIIAKKIFYSDSSDEKYLSYSLFESNYNWAIDAVATSSIEFEKKIKENNNPNYVAKAPSIIDGIKVYTFDDVNNSYLFVSENKVLKIDNTFENITNNHFISLVLRKVFNKDTNL